MENVIITICWKTADKNNTLTIGHQYAAGALTVFKTVNGKDKPLCTPKRVLERAKHVTPRELYNTLSAYEVTQVLLEHWPKEHQGLISVDCDIHGEKLTVTLKRRNDVRLQKADKEFVASAINSALNAHVSVNYIHGHELLFETGAQAEDVQFHGIQFNQEGQQVIPIGSFQLPEGAEVGDVINELQHTLAHGMGSGDLSQIFDSVIPRVMSDFGENDVKADALPLPDSGSKVKDVGFDENGNFYVSYNRDKGDEAPPEENKGDTS